MNKFWSVIVEGTDGGRGFRHPNQVVAEQEGERLCQKEGKRAFVLELVACFSPAEPVRETIEEGPEPKFKAEQPVGFAEVTYTLSCDRCNRAFYSHEAFPSYQLCPECVKGEGKPWEERA